MRAGGYNNKVFVVFLDLMMIVTLDLNKKRLEITMQMSIIGKKE